MCNIIARLVLWRYIDGRRSAFEREYARYAAACRKVKKAIPE